MTVEAAERAVRIAPPQAYGRYIVLSNLSLRLATRYVTPGIPDRLQRAIRFRQDALAAISSYSRGMGEIEQPAVLTVRGIQQRGAPPAGDRELYAVS